MKLRKIAALCIAALILAVAPVIASEIYRSKPIVIETALNDSKISSEVKLNRGKLRFKTPSDVEAELTPADIEENTPSSSEYSERYNPLPYFALDYTRSVNRADMMELMNIHPEAWHISDQCGEETREKFVLPHFYTSKDGDYKYADFYMFHFEYGKYSPSYISIRIAPSPVKYRLTSYNQKLLPVRLEYGTLDSRVGDTDISILQTDEGFGAFFNIKNASYEISARGISQRDFAELIISICEAPHPNDDNAINYIFTMPVRKKQSERDNLADMLRELYGKDCVLYLPEADVYCYVRPSYSASGEPTVEPLVFDPEEKFYEGGLVSLEPSKPVFNVGESVIIRENLSENTHISYADTGSRLDMSADGKWYPLKYIEAQHSYKELYFSISSITLVGSASGWFYEYDPDTRQFVVVHPEGFRRINLYEGHYRFVTWYEDNISGERYTVACKFDVK